MKYAYMAAVAASLLSTPSFAAQITSVNIPNYYTGSGVYSTSTIINVLTSGYYNFSLFTDLKGSTTLASVTADIFKTGASAAFASVGGPFGVDTPKTKTSSEYLLTAGTDYTVKWSAFSLGGSTAATLSATAVTAVPGPEAGAGLGTLAMLGVAYWAKRRRSESTLAA
jgi:hypothetical protein